MPPATDASNLKLRDQAYGYICRQFVDGRLQAGSRLSVGTLAKEIGISRTPVAEALLRLQMENVVEQVPRVGTIVRKPDVKEIEELYELRELLEGPAAAKAAERFSARELALLDRLVDEMRAVCVELRDSGDGVLSFDGVRRFLAADLAFHMVILRGVDNRWILRAIENARAFLLIFCARRHERHTLKTVAEIYRWHGRVRNAIRRRDAAAARQAMLGHIRVSCQGAIAYLKDHPDEGNYDLDLDREIASLIPRGFDSLSGERDGRASAASRPAAAASRRRKR